MIGQIKKLLLFLLISGLIGSFAFGQSLNNFTIGTPLPDYEDVTFSSFLMEVDSFVYDYKKASNLTNPSTGRVDKESISNFQRLFESNTFIINDLKEPYNGITVSGYVDFVYSRFVRGLDVNTSNYPQFLLSGVDRSDDFIFLTFKIKKVLKEEVNSKGQIIRLYENKFIDYELKVRYYIPESEMRIISASLINVQEPKVYHDYYLLFNKPIQLGGPRNLSPYAIDEANIGNGHFSFSLLTKRDFINKFPSLLFGISYLQRNYSMSLNAPVSLFSSGNILGESIDFRYDYAETSTEKTSITDIGLVLGVSHLLFESDIISIEGYAALIPVLLSNLSVRGNYDVASDIIFTDLDFSMKENYGLNEDCGILDRRFENEFSESNLFDRMDVEMGARLSIFRNNSYTIFGNVGVRFNLLGGSTDYLNVSGGDLSEHGVLESRIQSGFIPTYFNYNSFFLFNIGLGLNLSL